MELIQVRWPLSIIPFAAGLYGDVRIIAIPYFLARRSTAPWNSVPLSVVIWGMHPNRHMCGRKAGSSGLDSYRPPSTDCFL
jgi:hypothetical protein